MDIRQLRYFVEIIEQGSLSRAATRLNVAQPALSIHLRNMEAELGTELLLRSRSGVVPTEAGEILLRYARTILNEQASALDEIRSLGRAPSGEVRIGLPGTVSDILTMPLIEAAAEGLPRVRVTVSEAMSGFVADWLREARVDLAMLYAVPDDPGMASCPVLDEELVLAAAPGALPPGPVGFAALEGMPLILPSRQHGLRAMLEGELARHGLRLEPKIEIDSYRNIKALLARGRGMSILPRQTVWQEREAGTLDLRPFAAPGLSRRVHLVWRGSKAMPRHVRAVRDLLEDQIRQLVAGGQWLGATLHPGFGGAEDQTGGKA
ncbi:MAG: LysR family transcriptional regulator [Paracoccus denitrificans]|uniref:LysR family transcriptional regulator n=1 Tax=Paracoccus denitrificans TaxID=266 RepID=A0A533I316_PARDE|nr:MAG: LysR family transcriptional regulator [Paracoccus denitrificans]